MASYRSVNSTGVTDNSANGGYGLPLRTGNVRQLTVNSTNRGLTSETGAPRSARANLLIGLRTNTRAATVPESAPPTQLHHPNVMNHSIASQNGWNYYNQVPQSATTTHFSPNLHMITPSVPFLQQHEQQHFYQQQQQQLLMQQYLLQQNQRAGVYQTSNVFHPAAAPGITPLSSSTYNQFPNSMPEEYNLLGRQKERLELQLQDLQRQEHQRRYEQLDESMRNFSMQSAPPLHISQPQTNNRHHDRYSSVQSGTAAHTRLSTQVAGQPGWSQTINTLTNPLFSPNDPAQLHASMFVGSQAIPQHNQSYMLPADLHAEPPNPPFAAYDNMSYSPPPGTPTFRAQVTPPCDTIPNPLSTWRSKTPPKLSSTASSTLNVETTVDLPPPSAKAFRPPHRKGFSLAVVADRPGVSEGPRTGGLRPLTTPMTGTFDPGHAREGEHAIRQPKLPPSIEELIAKPTSKHEGSKNFVSRQRTRAITSLVRAGLERRSASPRVIGGSMSSSSSGTRGSVGDGEAALSNSTSASPLSDHSQSDGFAWTEKRSATPGDKSPASMNAIGSERKALKTKKFE